MSNHAQWLIDLGKTNADSTVEGLVSVKDYVPRDDDHPEVVAIMLKAKAYEAHSVFFEAGRNGRAPVAQAFIFVSDDPANDQEFGDLHKRLWSWGGVPLLYRKTQGLVQLFRCAHKPDFIDRNGKIICKPVKELQLAAAISTDPWWNAEQLRNGTLWDKTTVSKELLSAKKAAHKQLINAVKDLSNDLNNKEILPQHLRRQLLILALLIAYLEDRGVFEVGYFGHFKNGATKFFHVLADGNALIDLLNDLERRFNGKVFSLSDEDREILSGDQQLSRFAHLIEGHETQGGQLTLWRLYSFKDLPVELISHIYQLFVNDTDTAVYTPSFLVRLMLDEALSWERIDRLHEQNEILLDPSCGSGVFLVEAYKRLVLHWRSRNGWEKPSLNILQDLLMKVHGIDLEEGAVQLTAFSLCLALCDALEPETIRSSIRPFPLLEGKTLHHCCFFEAKEQGLVQEPIGVLIGNPPFKSKLTTPGARLSYERYQTQHGTLPDMQLAYLFLHDTMEMIAEGGLLCMLQQYNFLYNQQSRDFRHRFISRWDLREVLDFISVRGLFHADTKVVVVVAESATAPPDRKILHATFRRSGRVHAEQGFDIDYYDLHWLPRELVLNNDGVWRTDLLGGGRMLGFVDRLKKFPTLKKYVDRPEWDVGEGFIEAKEGKRQEAPHITGKPLIEPSDLQENASIDRLKTVTATDFISKRSPRRFQSPMVLIHEHEDLTARFFPSGYYTYKHKIVGICAPSTDAGKIENIAKWLKAENKSLQAFVTAAGTTTFTQKASWVGLKNIKALPYPETGTLDLSSNEQILVDDVIDYYRDFVRLGENSRVMKQCDFADLESFNNTFTSQINAIYKKKPLQALESQTWPGIICQPFVFGQGKVDWTGADGLRGKLDQLLQEQKGESLRITRIARIYDDNFVFLLKPDRLRYWLRSVALRDADETLADLREQGF